jgi:hypothetical protein
MAVVDNVGDHGVRRLASIFAPRERSGHHALAAPLLALLFATLVCYVLLTQA